MASLRLLACLVCVGALSRFVCAVASPYQSIHGSMTLDEAMEVHLTGMRHGQQKMADHGHVLLNQGVDPRKELRNIPFTMYFDDADLSQGSSLEGSPSTLHSSTPKSPASIFSSSCTSDRSINPVDYGADPTGLRDSTDAFLTAVEVLLNTSCIPQTIMAYNVTDLGGTEINLQYGQYLISKPIHIPSFYGHYAIRYGTIRASESFPKNLWLLNIGDKGCSTPQKTCSIWVNIEQVMFDSAHIAAGSIVTHSLMGLFAGPTFHIGFNVVGIQLNSGHALMLSDSWLAQYYWNETPPPSANATAVQLNNADNLMFNVIVFQHTNVGVSVNGGGAVLHGVHVWNGNNKTAIALDHQSTRVTNCYFDGAFLHLTNPQQLVIQNSFFLNTFLWYEASGDKAQTTDVIITDNTFTTQPCIIRTHWFQSTSGIQIQDNLNCPMATRAIKSVPVHNSTSVTVDFCAELLFDQIQTVFFSHTITPPPPQELQDARALNEVFPVCHALATTTCNITIQCTPAFNGSLTVEAIQGNSISCWKYSAP
eukprot:m.23966 g.23966  ORF g.23966 m.23966 type:complete len:536 (-) comp8549_c0_seq2:46-1653(-)